MIGIYSKKTIIFLLKGMEDFFKVDINPHVNPTARAKKMQLLLEEAQTRTALMTKLQLEKFNKLVKKYRDAKDLEDAHLLLSITAGDKTNDYTENMLVDLETAVSKNEFNHAEAIVDSLRKIKLNVLQKKKLKFEISRMNNWIVNRNDMIQDKKNEDELLKLEGAVSEHDFNLAETIVDSLRKRKLTKPQIIRLNFQRLRINDWLTDIKEYGIKKYNKDFTKLIRAVYVNDIESAVSIINKLKSTFLAKDQTGQRRNIKNFYLGYDRLKHQIDTLNRQNSGNKNYTRISSLN